MPTLATLPVTENSQADNIDEDSLFGSPPPSPVASRPADASGSESLDGPGELQTATSDVPMSPRQNSASFIPSAHPG